MQERHNNKERYFQEQSITTRKFVIPYLSDIIEVGPQTEVLEIGCAEAGNLIPFLDLGCKATGIDISCSRIELAREFFKNHPQNKNLHLICKDIYLSDLDGKKFDIIMMRDVIEHIPDQKKFMNYVKKFLKPEGKFFLAFPPWQNPFGGHQQICQNRLLAKMPYFHLLPRPIYRFILNIAEPNKQRINELLFIKQTGISIDRFERIIQKENYTINKRTLYLINPNYETKFGIKPRKQNRIVTSIPWVRNFLTTAVYYVLSK
ncbi:MAG: class I SAM-dependent methyltransferase [Mariniphaga sp.]|nr:class I SAM-dependent methyltransferase [Mariniphaga sp.]MDD4226271.1 class I SAM-dependent methyltransferase [Mariniphaga sp.]